MTVVAASSDTDGQAEPPDPPVPGRRADTLFLPLVIAAAALVVLAVGVDAGRDAAASYIGLVIRSIAFTVAGAAAIAGLWRSRPLPPDRRRNPLTAATRQLVDAVAHPARLPLQFDDARRMLLRPQSTAGVLARVTLTGALSPVALLAGVVALGLHVIWPVAVVGAAVVGLVVALAVAPALAGSPHSVFPGSVAGSTITGVPVTLSGVPITLATETALVALRSLALGAAVVAVAVGVPGAGALDWLAEHPQLSVPLAVVVAWVASIGPEAAPFAAAAFVPLGPGAQVAFLMVAATTDLRTTVSATRVLGGPVAARIAVTAGTCALAVGLWVGVAAR